ncbi:hypothetical protein EST38_g13987 [Candolleomyces aberdarensis]|uniref:DUF6533 domain-containing protein n=1 Tax=Candolleomyces aberdarensis TaxID=2316362 RepID=A0A4Q2CZE9_9AGAR|nr:hypothetical protein EST38_g13987 [Candolleomyces aberdarensis]
MRVHPKVWEYLQTVDIEARVIWSADWGVVKCLFLLNRYLPFIFMPLPVLYDNSQHFSPTVCKMAHRIGAVAIPSFMAIAEAFMYIRTYALSYKSKHFTIFLCINALVSASNPL